MYASTSFFLLIVALVALVNGFAPKLARFSPSTRLYEDFRKNGNNYDIGLFSEAQLKNGQFAADYEWSTGSEVPYVGKKAAAAPKKAAAAPEKKGLASFFGKKPAAKK